MNDNSREIAKLQLIIDFITEYKEMYADDVVEQIDYFLTRPLGESMRTKLESQKQDILNDKIAFANSDINRILLQQQELANGD